jgi:hypothetical protein
MKKLDAFEKDLLAAFEAASVVSMKLQRNRGRTREVTGIEPRGGARFNSLSV